MSLLQRIRHEVHEGSIQCVPQRQVHIEMHGCTPNQVIALASELSFLHTAQARVLMTETGVALILSSESGIVVSDVQHDLSVLLA